MYIYIYIYIYMYMYCFVCLYTSTHQSSLLARSHAERGKGPQPKQMGQAAYQRAGHKQALPHVVGHYAPGPDWEGHH
jgi:hypothetical protein